MVDLQKLRADLLSPEFKLSDLKLKTTSELNLIAMDLLQKPDPLDARDVNDLGLLLNICNILYNNTDMDPLPIEDGVYDLLLEKYKKYNPNFQVGAEPVQYTETVGNIVSTGPEIINPFIHPDEKFVDPIFEDRLFNMPIPTKRDFTINPFIHTDLLSKGLRNTAHNYPELVGTLNKCKFVANYQAQDQGVFDDPKVQILERDFFQPVIEAGILDPNKEFSMVLELKYDGISVEADILNGEVVGARSRGDTGNDEATDLTPILQGYKFKHATDPRLPDYEFGMKFEAVITYDNIERMRRELGKDYKNARNAIIGIFGSSNARMYRDYITLVPLATSLHGMNRVEELEFMNKYYHSGEYCRYTVVTGNFLEVMYMIKRFVDEAEYVRGVLPIMYDGVVVSFLDPVIREKLGRKNSVNQYSAAVKFNTMKKLTRFIGYTYTVGQTGSITPMINYTPIEFYGMVQTKSSGHSYKRFKELGLRVGDVLMAEYVNDVMTYITKPDIEENLRNEAPVVEFITHCPECGHVLVESDSGKSIYCPNPNCKGRKIARMTAMLKKINFKGVAEETVKQIDIYTLREFLEMDYDYLKDHGVGPEFSANIIEQIKAFKASSIYDYRIIGALGFTNLAEAAWKIVLQNFSLEQVMSFDDDDLRIALMHLKGLGPISVQTIVNERKWFADDLIYISKMPNVIVSLGQSVTGKHIRFSGCRDHDMMTHLQQMGHDCTEGSVTRETDILLVPALGFTSTKTAKLPPNAIIVPIGEFRAHMEDYLK